MSLMWLKLVNAELRAAFREVRHGYRCEPVGFITIPTADLRVRREPLLVPRDPADLDRLYEAPSRKAVNPIERFFPLDGGKQDRRLVHTPHCKLLEHYHRTGEKLYEHDYARLLAVRAAMQGRTRTAQYLRDKVDGLCRTFDSIRDKGYLKGRHRRTPIAVFDRPIHPPADDYEPRNYEIMDGHHRGAALCVLGVERASVLLVRAVRVEDYDFTTEIPWDETRWPSESVVGKV